MATFKPIIRTQHKRQDGTYNLKIRVIHNRMTRFVSTQWYVGRDDLTRTLKLKNQRIIDAVENLIMEYRGICNTSGAMLDSMSVDEVVAMVKAGKISESANAINYGCNQKEFDLDIVEYTRQYITKLYNTDHVGTARVYKVAIDSLVKFANSEVVSIFALTPKFLTDWMAWIMAQPVRKGRVRSNRAPSQYIASIRAMYNRAKKEFNDEEATAGAVKIPYYPFAKIEIPKIPMARKRALTIEQVRHIASLPDKVTPAYQTGVNRFNLARDVFMISFMLVGMNAVDLYHATDLQGGRLTYQRQKTRNRRADRAEISIKIEPELMPLLEKYRDKSGKRVFNFYQSYASMDTFTAALNQGLKRIGALIGEDDLEFYAARHSWATIAANDAEIDKYTVHEALNHVDPTMKVTDIYIRKNWSNIDRANRKVLDLLFPASLTNSVGATNRE